MATNVEIEKNNNENTPNIIRRFSKLVRSSGVLKRLRSVRYNQRKETKFFLKKNALHKLEKKAKYDRLYKLGKIK